MKKRKRTNEQDPKWWEALHKIQDWNEAGISHRKIADRLFKEGYTLGRDGKRFWTDTAVTRALDEHPKYPVTYPVKWADDSEDPDNYIDVQVFNDDGSPKKMKQVGTATHPGEFEAESEAQHQAAYEAFKAEIAKRSYVSIQDSLRPNPADRRAYPQLQPRDWTVGAESVDWTNTWTARTL